MTGGGGMAETTMVNTIPTAKARRFMRENPYSADDAGIPELFSHIAQLKSERLSLLRAAEKALRVLTLARDDLAMGGNGGAGDDAEICAEARALTPAIKKLRKAIDKAHGRSL